MNRSPPLGLPKEPRNVLAVVLAILLHVAIIAGFLMGIMHRSPQSAADGAGHENFIANAKGPTEARAHELPSVEPPANAGPAQMAFAHDQAPMAFGNAIDAHSPPHKRSEKMERLNRLKHASRRYLQAQRKIAEEKRQRLLRQETLEAAAKRKLIQEESVRHERLATMKKKEEEAARENALAEDREIERIHQEEMRRITSGMSNSNEGGKS